MKRQISWLIFGTASGSFFGFLVSKGAPEAAVLLGILGAVFGEIGYLIVNFLHRKLNIDRNSKGSKIFIGATLGGLLGAGLGPFFGLGKWALLVFNPEIQGSPVETHLGVVCGVLLAAAIGGCFASLIPTRLNRQKASSDPPDKSLSEI